ncbi:MAG: nuclear transport factor 2 family protein, partial [Nocardioides sp.]
ASYVGSSELVWLAQESSALLVRVHGDAAVVTLDVHDRGAWRGEPFEGDFRSMFVYVRREGAWRCVAGQTTARSSETF